MHFFLFLVYSIKSAYTNASTLVSKRVEEIRESVQQQPSPPLSPAVSQQYLSVPDHARVNDDAGSNNSGDSR